MRLVVTLPLLSEQEFVPYAKTVHVCRVQNSMIFSCFSKDNLKKKNDQKPKQAKNDHTRSTIMHYNALKQWMAQTKIKLLRPQLLSVLKLPIFPLKIVSLKPNIFGMLIVFFQRTHRFLTTENLLFCTYYHTFQRSDP